MLRIFIGVDSRQPVAYTVLQTSILARCSVPVSITPLILDTLPITRRGLTEFTFTRYLPPWLCDYEGVSLFLDADMLLQADVAELFALHDPQYAVQVVDCPKRFERPSMMLFNNAKCRVLTPEYVQTQSPHALEWGSVGFLPKEWNNCLGYEPLNPDAKLLHYTMGIPAFEETQHIGAVDEWFAEFKAGNHSCSYQELMGQSVHKPGLVEPSQR